ncbi:MAG TPA: exodeoxyribonuclease VII large subunit [Sphingomicrobium sp.]|nr:exodeoxyribonuclease VII large subunit [Sphingomicrobium sp.]
MDASDPASDDQRPGLLAKLSATDNSPPLSVSELSGALKRAVESAFGFVRVRGEISGWKRHGSGHCYFTLKDEAACIDAVIWRGQASGLAFQPEDGLEVIATGKLTTYAGRSKYQIVVDRLEVAGEGALMALLEQRKRALAAESLFDERRKRALPFVPRLIGVVTSPTGAVIRDILHRLQDRFPTGVLLWPVPVQGDGSAARVAAAIRGFAAIDPRPDLLIVARGGGSIEDLWAFNEEEVVRAAAESPIPLISAVGHETDTTLIDLAADRRAPTPTAAAEMAVPVRTELAAMLAGLGQRAEACVARAAARAAERVELIMARWPDAAGLFAPASQRLDEIGDRLPRALAARAAHARADLSAVAPRLRFDLMSQRLDLAAERLASLWRLAGLAHPERPLQRGFVRVTDRNGRTLIHAADARSAGNLNLRFADGLVEAIVEGSVGRLERSAPKSYRPQRPKPGPAPQPGLFDEE